MDANAALPFSNPRRNELHELAAQVSPLIHLGASTWSYEGWRELVYFQSYTKQDFAKRCLEEYAQYPLFSTVGIDRFFYAPPARQDLLLYAEQLPENFPCAIKVWEQITVPRFANFPKRYGDRAGQDNANYLNADLLCEAYIEPFARFFSNHARVFIFEFQRLYPRQRNLQEFVERLDEFFGALPAQFRYAVELRTREYLEPAYFDCLRRHNVAHCFNHWTHMPPLAEQFERAGGFTSDLFVCRLLTPIGAKYADCVAKFKPYNHLQLEQPQMRSDIAALCVEAAASNRPAFVLVNNRSEGCAPLTIEALARLVIERSGGAEATATQPRKRQTNE